MPLPSIVEVYPDLGPTTPEGGISYGPCDYDPLLKSLGHEIILKVDDNDYQGDSRLVLKDGDRFGILIFGWGSCSGCDSLQACESIKEIEKLRDQLASDIKWFDSKAACLEYVNTHKWDCDYSYSSDETKQFIEKAKSLLSA